MRSKMPVCPNCDADELVTLWYEGDKVTARCHECGWRKSDIVLEESAELYVTLRTLTKVAQHDTPQ